MTELEKNKLILKGLYYLAAYDTSLSPVMLQEVERLIHQYEQKVKNPNA